MDELPIIQGLTNEQFEKILSICKRKTFSKDEVIFSEGTKSDDMYILTEGVLQVTLWGKEVNRILPISSVGEMGVFTGEPRSATVIAKTECTLLRITKKKLFDLFDKDKDLHIQFQLGMLIDLSQKLRLTNEVIAKMRKAKFGKIR